MAITACGSSDDDPATGAPDTDAVATTSDTSDTSEASENGAAEPQGLQQNGPVNVDGAPLDPFGNSPDDPAVGTAAPVVSGESFDGTPITIGGESENPTLVVFLAHWCPHCNEEVPELIELNDSGELPDGLDVIAVSTGVDPSGENFPPSDWLDDRGWPWPTMADDEEATAIKAMGGTSFPFAVVLDTDGTVLARRAGTASAAETVEFLEGALDTSAG